MSPTFSAAGIANMQCGDPEIFAMKDEGKWDRNAIFMGYYKSIVWYKWYIYIIIYIIDRNHIFSIWFNFCVTYLDELLCCDLTYWRYWNDGLGNCPQMAVSVSAIFRSVN
jgi:hypothetical protein